MQNVRQFGRYAGLSLVGGFLILFYYAQKLTSNVSVNPNHQGTSAVIPIFASPPNDAQVSPKDRIETRSTDIVLRGTFIGEKTQALIEFADGRQSVVRVDEKISEKLVVRAIFYQSVSLDDDGTVVELRLNVDRSKTGDPLEKENATTVKQFNEPRTATFEAKLAAYINGRPVADVAFPRGTRSYGVEMVGDNQFNVNRRAIFEQSNMANFSEFAHFRATTNNELELTEIVPGSLYDAIGLQAGDRVLTINHRSIAQFSTIADVQEILRSNEQALIQINRSGAINEILLNIR